MSAIQKIFQMSSSWGSAALAYKQRVEADGGEVIDMTYVSSIYNLLNQLGISGNGLVWISPNAGIKKDGSNRISKAYNLFGTNDAVQTTDVNKPIFTTNGLQWNKKNYWKAFDGTANGKSFVFTNLVLPTYIDVFCGVECFAKTSWGWQHGTNVSTGPGAQTYITTASQRWAYNRDGAMNLGNNTSHSSVTDLNYKRIFTQRYNSTIGRGQNWVNRDVRSISGTDTGTLRSDSNTTANFTLYTIAGASGTPDSGTDLVIFPQLSTTNFNALREFLITAYNGKNFVFDGNSLVFGTGATGGSSFPVQFYNLFVASPTAISGFTGYNLGIAGQTIDAMLSDITTQVDPLYYNSGDIYIGWEIINQYGQTTNTPDQIFDKYKSVFTGRLAAGFKCIALTALPMSFANYETARGTQQWNNVDMPYINARIRNELPALGIEVADVQANATLGPVGSENNTTYYTADKLHLTNAGYAIVAQIVYNKVLIML